MQAVSRRTLQSLLQTSARQTTSKAPRPATVYHICSRCFHQARITRQSQNEGPPDQVEQPLQKLEEDVKEASAADNKAVNNAAVPPIAATTIVAMGGDPPDDAPPARPRGRPSGSRLLQRRMPVKKGEPPLEPPDIPEWFLHDRIFLPSDLVNTVEKIIIYEDELDIETSISGTTGEATTKTTAEAENVESKQSRVKEVGTEQSSISIKPTEQPETKPPQPEDSSVQDPEGSTANTPSQNIVSQREYMLNEAVWKEILAHVRGSLLLPKTSFKDSFAAVKSHLVLMFPEEDGASGTYFLDAISERIAAEVGATLIRIDAQDIEEIAGDFLGDVKPATKSSPLNSYTIRSLGYDAQLLHKSSKNPDERSQNLEKEEPVEEEEEENQEEEEDEDSWVPSQRPLNLSSSMMRQLGNMLEGQGKFLGAAVLRDGVLTPLSSLSSSSSGSSGFSNDSQLSRGTDRIQQAKVMAVLNAIINAGDKKREIVEGITTTDETESSNNSTTQSGSTKTIVNIRDYRDIEKTTSGAVVLGMLHELIEGLRRQGQEIIILGNACLGQSAQGLNRPWLSHIQNFPADGIQRTIVIPPQASQNTRDQLKQDRAARFREVNIRHLQDVIRRRSGDGPSAVTLDVPKDWHHEAENFPIIENIGTWCWTFDKVHRVAVTALGLVKSDTSSNSTGPSTIGIQELATAVDILDRSDKSKISWAAESQKQIEAEEVLEEVDERTPEEKNSEKIAKLNKRCSAHEKKLLGGVVNAENIKVGFSSIRAPEETVAALKTLTSLSLVRPEAFSYGVLASDRIPGVLLYGPPGTGKTMLAKAVAKESGATVLEVSGSEVFDMYVGEAEKNVKAIFTLAKKLTPCVVFIDEADAIFGSRQSHSTRTTHRELINQFLKEWDGMAQTSAFIMVATNRPFDLDDAVLRRLPRRILVDLPTSADRLAILKLHLSAEHVALDVDLEDIASDAKTNLYSGSDLKNLAVAAALSCVREENETFKETGTYPEKRTLEQRHFDKALNEISASISEDMGSLVQIRKFDEKYGEKSGRKKKTSKWGFGGAASVEDPKEKGSGRVRT